MHRHQTPHQGPRGRDHHDGVALPRVGQPAHDRHAPREQVVIDGQHGERRLIHVGKVEHGNVAGPHANVMRQLARSRLLGGHDDERAPQTFDQLRDVQGLEGVAQFDGLRVAAEFGRRQRRGQRRLGGEFSREV